MRRYLQVKYNGKKTRSYGYEKYELGLRYYVDHVAKFLYVPTSYGYQLTKTDPTKAITGIPTIQDVHHHPWQCIRTLLNLKPEDQLPDTGDFELLFVRKTRCKKTKCIEGFIRIRWIEGSINTMVLVVNGNPGYTLVDSRSVIKGDVIDFFTMRTPIGLDGLTGSRELYPPLTRFKLNPKYKIINTKVWEISKL